MDSLARIVTNWTGGSRSVSGSQILVNRPITRLTSCSDARRERVSVSKSIGFM